MLCSGALGLLFVAGFGDNVQAVFAESNAPTVIHIATTVQHADVKRLGMNISGQQYWDSGQMLRDLTFNNPGFEAEQWQSILTCSAVHDNTCTDGNGWSQWPEDFLKDGTYEFIYGSSKGRAGRIVSMTGSGATPSHAGRGNWYNFGSTRPAVGDVFIVRKEIPGSPDAGWWPNTQNGATITPETNDLSRETPGKQAVSLNASKSRQYASETSYFDGSNGRNFILLNGTYTITFRAKSAGGSNQLNVSAGRVGKSYFDQNIPLTESWKDYSFTFNARETEASTSPGFLQFSVSGGKVLLDDAALTESAAADNPTPFRNAVVDRLRELNPGVLRYMDSGIDFGSSIDNMIAVPDARLRAGSLQKMTEQTMVPLGLEEFLQLCEAVDAEPWFTVPMNIEPAEMQHLIEFLGGSSSTPYGEKRRALGQAVPWTSVFRTIHLEIGNEMWNFGFTGEMMPSPNAYGARAGEIFSAARSSRSYRESSFDLILDGQAVNPWVGQQVINSAKNNYDTIDAAPYTFNTLVDYSSNEAIFGSMFAEPEGVDSRSTGYMYQQKQMASGESGEITGKPAKLAVYEVSLSTLSGTAPQNVVNAVVPSLGAGLSTAEHMLLMMRDDGILLQNMFALPGYLSGFYNSNGHNESVQMWGTVVDMGGPSNTSRPYFLAEQLANTAIGGNMLSTSQTGSNPTWNAKSRNGWGIDVNGAHYIQSFAFANGTENSLVIFNLSRTTALPVTFAGPNVPKGLVQVGLLTSAKITDNNETSNTVKIRNSTIQNFKAFGLTKLPPYSMTVYRWSSSASGSKR